MNPKRWASRDVAVMSCCLLGACALLARIATLDLTLPPGALNGDADGHSMAATWQVSPSSMDEAFRIAQR